MTDLDLSSCVEILPRGADRDTWLATRREGIGGSDASTIAGVSSFKGATLFRLWLDKTGRLPDEDLSDRDYIWFGNVMEPILIQRFSEETGLDVTHRGTLRSVSHPHMLYNPDGIASCGGLVEVKTAGEHAARDWADDQTADHAEIQVQHGMAVTGTDHAHVIAWVGRRFITRPVERDQKLIDTLTDLETEFWYQNVLADVEPPMFAPDLNTVTQLWRHAKPDTIARYETPEARAVVERFIEARALAKDADDAKKQAQAELVHLIGEAGALELVIDGQNVTAATRYEQITRRIDLDALGPKPPNTDSPT